jgi:hypothetical protein
VIGPRHYGVNAGAFRGGDQLFVVAGDADSCEKPRVRGLGKLCAFDGVFEQRFAGAGEQELVGRSR